MYLRRIVTGGRRASHRVNVEECRRWHALRTGEQGVIVRHGASVALACPEGLEPPTCCLEGSCSIQLSYGQPVLAAENNEPLANVPTSAEGPDCATQPPRPLA
jgi:hypothetical protein